MRVRVRVRARVRARVRVRVTVSVSVRARFRIRVRVRVRVRRLVRGGRVARAEGGQHPGWRAGVGGAAAGGRVHVPACAPGQGRG